MRARSEIITILGVPVVCYHMRSIEVCVTSIDFKAGSYYESRPNWGGVHFLEHMMHEGSEKFPQRQLLEIYKEEHAISQNAYTSGQVLSFEANFPTISLAAGFDLLTEIVAHPTFPEYEIKKEQAVVTQEYRDKWSQPNSRLWRASVQNLYGTHHMLSQDPLGQPEYVQSLTREDLQNLYKKYVNANALTMSVVGNYSRPKLIKALTNFIKALPRAEHVPLVSTPPQTVSNYLFHKEDMDRASVGITYLLPPRLALTRRERMTLKIASYILGGSPRSRIFQRLRGELGLTYAASCGVVHNFCASEFYLNASVSIEKAQEAVHELHSELQKFMKTGPEQAEFDRAKHFINLMTLTSFDSPYRINEKLSSELFADNEIIFPEEKIEMANTITKEELIQTLRNYVVGEPVLSVMAKEDPLLRI